MRIVDRIYESLYEGVVTAALLVVAPAFALHPRGKERFQERFGVWNLPPAEYVWIHGASAGELQSLIRLLPWLREQYPSCKVLLTSFSIAGIHAHGDSADEVRLLPFDASWIVKRAIENSSIRLFLFGETEFWPGLLSVLLEKRVPIGLINGRIEDRSFRWYSKLSSLFSPVCKNIAVATVTSTTSQDRLHTLGVPVERITVTGNLKYDREPKYDRDFGDKTLSALLHAEDPSLKARPVITLGSVHPGEECFWFDEYEQGKLKKLDSPPLFILAPRHLEKLSFFEAECKRRGLSYLKSSFLSQERLQESSVLLVDTFGELERFYSVSDLIFIGGTLVPIGGHNPFEAAPYHVPICMGHYTSQIEMEVKSLKASNAVFFVEKQSDVAHLLDLFFSEEEVLQEKAENLYRLWKDSRGALAEVESLLEAQFLTPSSPESEMFVSERR